MTSLSLSSKLSISPNILFREIQGEAVLLNAETGIYFGLDPVGTTAWHLIQSQKRLQNVFKALLTEYDVDSDSCREDLLRFASNLQKNGLIKANED